jgi:hypothetical protein
MRAYGELTRLHGTRTADRRLAVTVRIRWRLSGPRQLTLAKLQLEKPLASRLFLIIARTASPARKREASPIRLSISINIQRLARAVRCPNHPGAESIVQGPLGVRAACKCLPPFSSLASPRASVLCTVGRALLLRCYAPLPVSWNSNYHHSFLPPLLHLELLGRNILACYNNNVIGSAGRLAAAGCRPRC